MFRSIRLVDEARTGLRSLALGLVVALAGLTAVATPVEAQDPIRLGGEVQGRFQEGDAQLTSGEYVDVYVFEGRAGQQVTVRMSSSDVDSYVMIRGPSGFSEFNDDRDEGDVDAQLTVRLPANGQYRIQATTFAPGESGRYTLSLLEGSGPRIAAQGGGRAQQGTANAGQLSPSDDAISSGEYADSWSFTGTPGQTYVVRLNSAEFDPYLMVRGNGIEEDNDDDPTGRGSRNSRVQFVMPDTGEVSIITTSYGVGETGAYTLVLEEAGGTTAVASTSRSTSTLRPGQAVTGRLDVGSDTLRSGEYMSVYTLNGQAGDHVEITLRSDQFDPYLFVQGPGEFAVANDDDDTGEDGVNSRLILTLPASGEYQVVATSYAPGETGTYRLSVSNSDAGSVQTAVSPRASASFAEGVSLSGMLSASDEQLTSGEYADRYVISGRRGDRVALDLQSN
ncbi:MAG: PPC domain-containing protein, partial [Brevundimonas sp.]|uniref:PPC domain-containing protein n=1 Tax=Brevundimonas sp. TaxID=1871086 RepID=UPI002736ADF9